ncbi:Voltage-dependent calcium channel subunit alpha-2/delta-1 [Collichthys lucidus]|uniref:Voltage-dependent calcium channel subunit alpha-2/delta-1 n=1 Tax=Collichthys lucidus TaxID=240159 RepID=A0A4U5TWM8_COLLU|nr:Voltage-dependent calcium channel subunit alpha-2/delta-1 [Collichthys lucidus]
MRMFTRREGAGVEILRLDIEPWIVAPACKQACWTSEPVIKDWVDQMQKELITLTDTASGMQHLIQIYHKHSPHFTVETNNAIELVATAAGNIERLLANRSEALKRLATEAERYQMEHDWMRYDNEDEKIVYYNAKEDLNQTEEAKRENKRYIPDDFDIDPDFKRLVSYNTTAVHIPTDIYERLWVVRLGFIIVLMCASSSVCVNAFERERERKKHFGLAAKLCRYVCDPCPCDKLDAFPGCSNQVIGIRICIPLHAVKFKEKIIFYLSFKTSKKVMEEVSVMSHTVRLESFPIMVANINLMIQVGREKAPLPSVCVFSTIILNELNWTEALEDVFRKNKEEDPSLLWQVFGSATGLARYYPASPWINSSNSADKIDLYDVRMRPWSRADTSFAERCICMLHEHDHTSEHLDACTQTHCLKQSKPNTRRNWLQQDSKTQIILVLNCRSGSISGLTLKLIRTSVSKMLETLSDDDYVNVVYFNDQARYASCFENLVQANVRNKRKLKEAVQEITAKGITNYRSGFELAFKQLAQMNVSRANCNKIIMLFTDGGEEKAEEIFKKYNPNQAVRIFTFSVGQHNYDKGPIQWMACANKGYYYEIPSIGAIRINTQEYLDVLGRPMVKESKKAKQVQWTNVYLDALELGLVITGTLPVFNKTNTGSKKAQKFQNQLILGVMAIDVSLEDIKRLTPRFTFGPNGYYFAIDPNGYVLLHPNLQPLTAKFDEPVTLDFLDAELESDIKVERYIDLTQRTYTFAPVKGTDYSLALVLPEYSKHYIQANIGDTITQAKFSESLLADKFDEYGYTFIAPRVYCKDLKPPEKDKNNTEFLMEFNNYIDTKTPNHPLCNVELVNRLLLDAGITSELIKIWKKKDLHAGLSWKVEAETYESSVYKRSLDNDLYIFTPTPYPRENSSDDSVLVSRAVNININDITLKPAGAKFLSLCKLLAFLSRFMSFSRWLVPFLSPKTLGESAANRAVTVNSLFVLLRRIGNFFGVIDPILMRNLVNSSLFTSKKTFDYQSLCDPKKKSKVAAGPRSVYVPTIADILNVGWWATAAAWSVLQQLLVSITFPNFLDAAEMDDELSEAMRKEVCTTEQTQYYFETNQLTFRGNIDCENCTRMYHAEKLPKTNLVFIIADAKPTCSSCDTKPLIQDEQPCILLPFTWQQNVGLLIQRADVLKFFPDSSHPADGPNPCERAQNPRYRKGPAACFDNTEHWSPPAEIRGIQRFILIGDYGTFSGLMSLMKEIGLP